MTGIRAALALSALLGGCVQPPQACLLPSQGRMKIIALYFGRDIPGGGVVSEQMWDAFAARLIAPAFPDGFTVYDGQGRWRDPATSRIGREATKIVQIAVPEGAAGLADQLGAVIGAYKAQFRQQAVGIVTTDGCGAF